MRGDGRHERVGRGINGDLEVFFGALEQSDVGTARAFLKDVICERHATFGERNRESGKPFEQQDHVNAERGVDGRGDSADGE